MTKCDCCGEAFFPNPAAWGAETCGQCIASRIELDLLRFSGLLIPKPAKRAARPEEPARDIRFTERHRV